MVVINVRRDFLCDIWPYPYANSIQYRMEAMLWISPLCKLPNNLCLKSPKIQCKFSRKSIWISGFQHIESPAILCTVKESKGVQSCLRAEIWSFKSPVDTMVYLKLHILVTGRYPVNKQDSTSCGILFQDAAVSSQGQSPKLSQELLTSSWLVTRMMGATKRQQKDTVYIKKQQQHRKQRDWQLWES